MSKGLLIKATIFFSLLLPTSIFGEKLILNTGHNPPLVTDDHTGFHDLVAKEIYNRLGIPIEIHRLPSARSGRNANEGIDDGNGPRINGYNKYFPNLLMVPEEVIKFDFVGFTKNPSINPRTWDDLANLNVALVTGWKIFEINIKKYQSLTKVRSTEQLFRLLDQGRADIVFLERWQGLYAAKKQGSEKIHVVEPPFARKPMYFYLHKKHADLIPKVVATLQDMKRDGTFDRLTREKLLPLIPKNDVTENNAKKPFLPR